MPFPGTDFFTIKMGLGQAWRDRRTFQQRSRFSLELFKVSRGTVLTWKSDSPGLPGAGSG
jgi:hypothetical protein